MTASTDTRANAATVSAIYEAFGGGDIPKFLTYLAEDIRWESDWEDNFAQRPGGPAFFLPLSGRDNLGPFFAAMGANTFHQLDVRQVIADGDTCVARVALEYTMPSGGRYRDEQLHLWSFGPDGKVVAPAALPRHGEAAGRDQGRGHDQALTRSCAETRARALVPAHDYRPKSCTQ